MADDRTLRRQLADVLADLDALPGDAFADAAPLRRRADELREAIQSTTRDELLARDVALLDELRERARNLRLEISRVRADTTVTMHASDEMRPVGLDEGAAMVRMQTERVSSQGIDRLEADLAALESRIAAAEGQVAGG